MANDDHVALLEQGVAAWNAWRKDNAFKIRPNLRQSSFRGADLRRAIVKGADFYGANLVGTNLSEANLAGADLGSANLSGYTNLSGANLTRAKLYRAAAPYANLSGAKLIKALLDRAILGLVIPAELDRMTGHTLRHGRPRRMVKLGEFRRR